MLHPRELAPRRSCSLRLRRLGHVQRDEVGRREQRRRATASARLLPIGSLADDVVEDDAHAERLGEHADLRADVAVADDAERLAADLVAAARRPCATCPRAPRAMRSPSWRASMMISAMISSATLRVLENGALNTGTPRRLAAREVDLVGADAEAADARAGAAPASSTRGGDLRLAADAEQVHVRRACAAARPRGSEWLERLDLEALGAERSRAPRRGRSRAAGP